MRKTIVGLFLALSLAFGGTVAIAAPASAASVTSCKTAYSAVTTAYKSGSWKAVTYREANMCYYNYNWWEEVVQRKKDTWKINSWLPYYKQKYYKSGKLVKTRTLNNVSWSTGTRLSWPTYV